MSTHAERLMVLEMVHAKKITAGEGAQLIAALGEPVALEQVEPASLHWVRVRVTDAATGKQRANLRLPVGLVESGLKAGAHITDEIGGVSVERLLAAIEAGKPGLVIDEVDSASGRHVEITLE